MNEKIKEIAEFDGFRVVKRYPAAYGGGEPITPLITEKLACKRYLTDLNTLHKVAMDVMDKVSSENMIHRIHNAMLYRPINGEYTDLVDAVYEAIVYLKNHDLCQPK